MMNWLPWTRTSNNSLSPTKCFALTQPPSRSLLLAALNPCNLKSLHPCPLRFLITAPSVFMLQKSSSLFSSRLIPDTRTLKRFTSSASLNTRVQHSKAMKKHVDCFDDGRYVLTYSLSLPPPTLSLLVLLLSAANLRWRDIWSIEQQKECYCFFHHYRWSDLWWVAIRFGRRWRSGSSHKSTFSLP